MANLTLLYAAAGRFEMATHTGRRQRHRFEINWRLSWSYSYPRSLGL